MLPPIVMATFQNAVVFMTHRFMLGHIRGEMDSSEETYGHLFLSGAASGLVSSAIQCPTELIKIRLQLYSSNVNLLTSIYQRGNIADKLFTLGLLQHHRLFYKVI